MMLAMNSVKMMRVLMFLQLVDTLSNVIDSLLYAYLAVFCDRDQGFARQALFMGLGIFGNVNFTINGLQE